MYNTNKQIKVAWICHFSNQRVREYLPLSKMRLLNFLKSLFGKNRITHVDFAPWVSNLIKEFEKFSTVELHIISPHKGLKRFKYEFKIDGIYYHFFKFELSSLVSKLVGKIFKDQQKKYLLSRYSVRSFIKTINPDIVNLIGTENPHYCITVLDIKNIPVYVSVQTVYTNPDRIIYSRVCEKHKWDIELKIHKKEKYYGCAGRLHADLILKNNPNVVIFKNFFPVQRPSVNNILPKEFDFVFFAARVTPSKGVEDAIDALAIVKKDKPDVSLNIVGYCNLDYKKTLISIISNKGLTKNIYFTDYFPLHQDMHHHISKSRFAILPFKLDTIPSAIIEAMFLGIPIVAYKTSGTPYLNKDGVTVLLSDIGDIDKLAENMLMLLMSNELSVTLQKAAKRFAEKEFNNTKNALRLLRNYEAVINHYYNKTLIPEELLFDFTEFPIY